MNVFEKILERLEEKKSLVPVNRLLDDIIKDKPKELGQLMAYADAIKIVQEVAEEFATDKNDGTNGWIPCSEYLPEAEQEVLILTRRKKGDGFRYIVTSGFYEDGTVLENDSIWYWIEHDFEKYNEDEECYIIDAGWWEYRHYNPDDVYNNIIDDEVVAWKPLPEPYEEK